MTPKPDGVAATGDSFDSGPGGQITHMHKPEVAKRPSWESRQLVFARNKLLLAARQIDLAIERGGAERGLRAGFAFYTASEGMRELGRVERRAARRAA